MEVTWISQAGGRRGAQYDGVGGESVNSSACCSALPPTVEKFNGLE